MSITSPLWHQAMEHDSQRQLEEDTVQQAGAWSQNHAALSVALRGLDGGHKGPL